MSGSACRPPVLGLAAAALALVLAGPSPALAWRGLADLAAATDPTGPLVAALSLSAWALVAWSVVTVLLTAGSHCSGRAGRACAAVVRRIAPAAVRRTVEMALGLGLAAGAGAAPATALDATAPGAVAAVAPAVPLDRPGSAVPPDVTDLDWPVSRPEHSPPDHPRVVVRPGDTLWALAERGLSLAGVQEPSDAQVAQTWPCWWSANRDVIGSDPDLLRPGTVLTPPQHGAGAGACQPPASSS